MPDVDVAVVRDTTLLPGRGPAIDDSGEIRLGVETFGKSHSKKGMRTRRRISYVLLSDALAFWLPNRIFQNRPFTPCAVRRYTSPEFAHAHSVSVGHSVGFSESEQLAAWSIVCLPLTHHSLTVLLDRQWR